MKNIIFLAYDIYNPLSINWIHGFKTLGYSVTVLIAKQPIPDEQQLHLLKTIHQILLFGLVLVMLKI